MVAINTQMISKVQKVQGTFDDMTAGETAGEEAEALVLTVTNLTNSVDWSYSATAEDNTTDIHTPGEGIIPSEMDLQPGMIYQGPSGAIMHVKVNDVNILEGAIQLAEEGDGLNMAIYLNSTPMIQSEEGLTKDIDVEVAIEFTVEGTLHNVQENDVIRFGLYGTSEETLDWDNGEGAGEWSIS